MGQKIRGQIDMSTITSEPLWIIGVTRVWCHPRLRLYMIGNKLSATRRSRYSRESLIADRSTPLGHFRKPFRFSLLFAGDAREREKARENHGRARQIAIIHPRDYPSRIDFDDPDVCKPFMRYFICNVRKDVANLSLASHTRSAISVNTILKLIYNNNF